MLNKYFLKTYTLSLKKDGYDPFIDYLKGLSILFVVIQHSIPTLLHHYSMFVIWGRLAVPIFLLIQVFHAYKKLVQGGVKLNCCKLWKRILRPYLIVQLIIISLSCLVFHNPVEFCRIIRSGGIGSGGYYPWIYLQFALLLVLFAPLLKKCQNHYLLLFIFVLISQTLEVFCCIFDVPEWVYRLGMFRYFFIIYLGYILVIKGFELNMLNSAIGILSLLFLCFFSLSNINLRPLFYTGLPQWRTCHWLCYPYMCYVLLFVFRSIYVKAKNGWLTKWIKEMGRYSYEIFMFQMIYFFLCKNIFGERSHFSFASQMVYMLLAIILCTVPVVLLKNFSVGYNKLNK